MVQGASRPRTAVGTVRNGAQYGLGSATILWQLSARGRQGVCSYCRTVRTVVAAARPSRQGLKLLRYHARPAELRRSLFDSGAPKKTFLDRGGSLECRRLALPGAVAHIRKPIPTRGTDLGGHASRFSSGNPVHLSLYQPVLHSSTACALATGMRLQKGADG
jgi:hypothetical protein